MVFIFLEYERVGRSTSRITKSPSRYSQDSPSRKSPSRRSPSRRSPSKRSPSRRSSSRQSGKSPARSPTITTRKLPIRNTRLAKVSLSRIDAENGKHTFAICYLPHIFLYEIFFPFSFLLNR